MLLVGESGSGKELLAHAVHAAGPRRYGPFVGFSCAGVSDELVAAELFGYCAGSFTGATKEGRIGKIEVAKLGIHFTSVYRRMRKYGIENRTKRRVDAQRGAP